MFDEDEYIYQEKRAIFVCYQFLKELQKRFERKFIFTDGARRYKEACL